MRLRLIILFSFFTFNFTLLTSGQPATPSELTAGSLLELLQSGGAVISTNDDFHDGGGIGPPIVDPPPPGVTDTNIYEFLTGDFPGGGGNTGTGSAFTIVGCKILVGTNTVYVTQLGRWILPGNVDPHKIEIRSLPFHTVIASNILSAVTVSNTLVAFPAGAYAYTNVFTNMPLVAFTLSANTAYELDSTEFSGDTFYVGTNTSASEGVFVTRTTNHITITHSGTGSTGAGLSILFGIPNDFGPVTFKYSLTNSW